MTEDKFCGTIILFSRATCIDSMQTKFMLHDMSIPFIDVCLESNPHVLPELTKFTSINIFGVSHIFFNDHYIPGFLELKKTVSDEEKWRQIMEQVKNKPAPENAPQISKYTIVSNNNEISDKKKALLNWIPTSYEKLVSIMRRANLIRNNRVSLSKTYKNSFKGEDFVVWIMKEKGIRRTEALELGEELIGRHFKEQLDAESPTFCTEKYYQLTDEVGNGPLNCIKPPTNKFSTKLHEFNELLKKVIEKIYADVLDNTQRLISLDNFEDNENFKDYLNLIRELVNVDVYNSSPDERLAFFVNIYNMQLLHTLHKYGIPPTVWTFRQYLYTVYYKIGDHLYSLHSIYNGILRGNKIGYKMLWEPFGEEDKRRPFMIGTGEPLVHFAVTTLRTSTPPIRAYSAKNCLETMRENAQQVLETDTYIRLDLRKNIIHLHRLFKIYQFDFGSNHEDIIEWIIDTMAETPKRDAIIKLCMNESYSVLYMNDDSQTNVQK